MIRPASVLFALLLAGTASAQWPIFDPDNSVDPRETGGGAVLISRLVVGGASNMSGDGFRPLGENIGYVHLANSFTWRSFQFDYKRSQLKAEGGEAAVWELPPRRLETQGQAPQFNFRQTRNATPKSKDTLQAAWYWPAGGGGMPVMLRSRLTYSRQPIETEIAGSAASAPQRVSGREQTFALDTDTWFSIGGYSVYGSLAFSETKTRTNAVNPFDAEGAALGDRTERALTYTNRFPSLSIDSARIVIRPTLTVGGISNRDESGVNLVSPAIEIFRPFLRSGANLHIIYSPQWVADGGNWKTTHQVAVFLDYALFFKVLQP